MSEILQLLLVEDSPEDAFAIQRYLKQSNLEYQLLHTGTSEEARNIILARKFDCILMDYQLPDYDGIEMLRFVRSTISHPVAVLILTGSGNERTAVEAMKSGADDYVAKGELSPLRLQNAITQAIKSVKLKAEVDRQNLELANYATELQRSNEALQRFAYVASHDMRQPLRMISSYLKLLEQRYASSLDEDAREFIGFASTGAKQLNQLLEDLLRYAQVNNNALRIEEVDTEHLVATVLQGLTVSLDEAGAEVRTTSYPSVYADRTLLWQLFQNLVTNAIKFRGSEKPVITIGCESRSHDVLFWVQDNGIGISPDDFNQIFVMFRRLNPQDRFEGTGIGLAICKSIVDRHGGKIWFESSYGQGTTFFFTLPVKPNSQPLT